MVHTVHELPERFACHYIYIKFIQPLSKSAKWQPQGIQVVTFDFFDKQGSYTLDTIACLTLPFFGVVGITLNGNATLSKIALRRGEAEARMIVFIVVMYYAVFRPGHIKFWRVRRRIIT